MNVFDPASSTALSIRDLFLLVVAISGLIFLAVGGMLAYCVVAFRQRGDSDSAEPPQIYGSKPIEVAWTVAPVLIVFILFLVVIRTVAQVRQDEPPPDAKTLRVTVVGRQWWWEYRYQSYGDESLGFTAANEMHIPASDADEKRPTFLDLQSEDVVHCYWVPRLAGKTDLLPGRTNRMWFQTKQAGLYLGQCAEYCGTQHANMIIRVIVDPPDKFAAWLAHERQPAVDDPTQSAGKKFFLGLNCVKCHTVRGTTAAGTAGPDLTHLKSRETLASGMVPNTRANLREWLRDPCGPDGIKPGCLMPDLQLDKRQLDLLVDYLETLK